MDWCRYTTGSGQEKREELLAAVSLLYHYESAKIIPIRALELTR